MATLDTVCTDILEHIIVNAIHIDLYSLGGLAVNKHIMTVVNEVWRKYITVRLKSHMGVDIEHIRGSLLHGSNYINKYYSFHIYRSTSGILNTLEFLIVITDGNQVSVTTRHYNVIYVMQPNTLYKSPTITNPERIPHERESYHRIEINSAVIYKGEHDPQSPISIARRRQMGQLMRRMMPEIADIFTF